MRISFLSSLLAFLFRVLPHLPNFSPFGASAIMAARQLSFKSAVALVGLQWMLGNLVLSAMHGYAVWEASYAYVVLGFLSQMGLARALRHRRAGLGLSVLFGAVLFFCVSNFGVWMQGTLYPRTLEGLTACYIQALPFLQTSLLGDALWTGVFVALAPALDRISLRRRLAHTA